MCQRNTYRVLQTMQRNLYFYVSGPLWAEPAVLGSTKTALKFKYETKNLMYRAGYNLKSERKNP